MKNLIQLILILYIGNLYSQTDTTVKSSWYMRSMPISLYTGAGKLNTKMPQNIEFGRSFGMIDAGLAFGRINQLADSNKYMEARITMDASQYGIFSNELSLGFGHVFNSNTPIMLEISYTVFAQVYKNWGLGIVTGYYDFSGDNTDVSKTYYGLFVRYGLKRSDGGSLINRKVHAHHR